MNDIDAAPFDASRAELFEALSHPLRVRILQVLGERPQRFSALKHTLGLESSGHLAFHLEKLGALVKPVRDGTYALSDEGRGALRLFTTLNHMNEAPPVHIAHKGSLFNRKIVTVSLLIIIIAGFIICSSVMGLQDQISGLQDQISVLQNENEELQNENAEFQDTLNALPFIQPFIQKCRAYIDDLNYLDVFNNTAGRISSIRLEEIPPIYDPPYEPSAEDCLVIQFEQANRPSHYFEVWIDANTSWIIGVADCRVGYDGVIVTEFYRLPVFLPARNSSWSSEFS